MVCRDQGPGTRDLETGVESVRTAFTNLPRGATVIDLGCGTGMPLAAVLVDMGLQVIGIDSSEKMINSFKNNFQKCTAHNVSIQKFNYSDYRIDSALCWGCLFHLQPHEQIDLLNKVFTSVLIGGRFLFSLAKEGDCKKGEMNGVEFNYHSLGSETYNKLAKKAGWRLIHERYVTGENYEYLFERNP